MALNAATWAANIKSALSSAGLLNGLTTEEKNTIESGWNAVATGNITHLTTYGLILTSGATGTGPEGGPLPIVSQPGIIT
jgi:hypothetical protein